MECKCNRGKSRGFKEKSKHMSREMVNLVGEQCRACTSVVCHKSVGNQAAFQSLFPVMLFPVSSFYWLKQRSSLNRFAMILWYQTVFQMASVS